MPILLRHPNHHVAAVQVLKVVGKGADGPQHLVTRGPGIPTGLELNPLGFYAATGQEILKIDGENRGHGEAARQTR